MTRTSTTSAHQCGSSTGGNLLNAATTRTANSTRPSTNSAARGPGCRAARLSRLRRKRGPDAVLPSRLMSGPVVSANELRVLAIATTLPGRAGDGTPEFVLTLASAMPSSRVVIVAPRVRSGPLIDHVGRVEIARVPYARKGRERVADDAILPALRSDPTLVRQLPRLLLGLLRTTDRLAKERQPHVLHAHWIVPAGLIALAVGRRRGLPYVVIAHGADAYALNGRIGRALKRMVLNRALAVYPVSHDIADRLRALGAKRVEEPLPMGVAIDELRAHGERKPGDAQLLFVGRLSDKKGVDVLLRALALVPDARLRIAGDGPDARSLTALAATLGVADRVEFLGRLERDEVLAQYRAAYAVVVPSRLGKGGDRDGTPVVLMEAMALGIPVVATDSGGIREQVRDGANGRLTVSDDPGALAQAIRELLDDPEEATRLGLAGADHARRHFDVHRLADHLESENRRLLEIR